MGDPITQPPSGTRDFLPEDIQKRERIFKQVKDVFGGFGFLPMDTPAFERIETLEGKYGEEGDKLMFRILKRGEQASGDDADLALRYDLTVPLVRYFAEYRSKLPLPFRRYQIAPVWRADRPGKGRFREFYQCDVDVIGSSSLLADVDVILALTKALSALGLRGYTVRLNSRKVLRGLLEAYKTPESMQKGILISLDKLDKVGVDGVVQELKDKGLERTALENIASDLSEKGVASVRNRLTESTIGTEGLAEVDEMIALLQSSLENGKVEFSPFLARGLDYYTGTIFEIILDGVPGSIAGGGRYDNLLDSIAGITMPACGGSLGIDRILSTLDVTGRAKETLSPKVFLTVENKQSRAEVLRIANELRNAGIASETSLEEGTIGEQMKLAAKRGALVGLVYGPNEQAKNEVTIRDLSTREQRSVARTKIADELRTLGQ